MFPTCSHILTADSMDPGTVGLGRSLAAWVMARWAASMAGRTAVDILLPLEFDLDLVGEVEVTRGKAGYSLAVWKSDNIKNP